MSSTRALILLLVFITSEVIIEATEEKTFLPAATVYISNGLESKSTLQIHCKDKHFDLGVHMLPYSQTYHFKIPLSAFFGETLYFCGFVWDNKLHWFDIYKKSRDLLTCKKKCRWVIKDVGPCLLGKHLGHPCFSWN